jgi:cytochrome c-type biogenesis protein CcmH
VGVLSAALLLGVGGFITFALWESLKPPAGPVRAGGLQIRLVTTPSPARVGVNDVRIDLEESGRAVDGARVELRYTLDPMVGANPTMVADAETIGAGRYRGRVDFSRPGPWQVAVLVKRPGRPDVETQYTFNLALDSSAVIAGEVRLAPGLAARMPPGAALFLIARRGPGPPVAVKRVADPRFPLAFTLGQADVMGGSAFEGELEVLARLKMDGQAGPLAAGDLEGRTSAPVRVGTRDLVVVIGRAS